MPRDSNGTYSLPAGNPVVTLTTISSTWANTTLDDIGTALTNSLDRAGSGGMTGQLKLANGLIGAPGLTWGTELASGFYRAGTNDFRFSVASDDKLQINASGVSIFDPLFFPDGTAANPSISFTLDTDVGLFRVTTNALGFTTSGTRRAYVDATTWVMEVPTYFPDGTAGSPSVSFASDIDIGMYRFGANQLGFATAGTHRMLISTGGVHVDSGQLFLQGGSVGAPSMTWASDTDTGIYLAATAIPLFVANGAESGRWSTQGMGFNDGSAGSPSLFFSGDANTGLYRATTDQIFFTEGGTGYRIGYRKIPEFSQNAGYTFVAADVGQCTAANSAGNFTIPPSVFSAGDVFMFVNTTGSNCTLVQGGGVTIRLLGTAATTGNRTVGSFGMATIYCQTSTVFLVSGPNVT